jgi:heptosyltransferase-2
MKILIIRFSTVTDIVLTTSMLRCLRAEFPNAQIHYLVKEKYKSILKANPNIDKLISFDGDLRDTVLNLIVENYDLAIDLQNSFRSHNITAMLRQAFNSSVKVRRVNLMKWRKKILSKTGVSLLPDMNDAGRYLKSVRKLGVSNDGQGLDFFIPEEEKIENRDLPMSHSAGYISFVLNSEKGIPSIAVEQWQEICSKIDYPIILQGTSAEKELGDKVAAIDPIRIYNSCGKFSLHESADIIRCAKVVCGAQSDLMTISAAYKRNIVAFYTNKQSKQGRYPYFGFNSLGGTKTPQLKMLNLKESRGQSVNSISTEKAIAAIEEFLSQ